MSFNLLCLFFILINAYDCLHCSRSGLFCVFIFSSCLSGGYSYTWCGVLTQPPSSLFQSLNRRCNRFPWRRCSGFYLPVLLLALCLGDGSSWCYFFLFWRYTLFPFFCWHYIFYCCLLLWGSNTFR